MKKLKLEELGRLTADEFRKAEKLPVCVVLDNLRSLHNVGSAFRTADAFRIAKVYLTGITGKPPHREIHKTALGATETVDWEYHERISDLLARLKSEGYQVVVVEQTTASIPVHEFKPASKVCLVFGNEVNGVSEAALALADEAVEIPQAGTKHSLNVSVCLGIVVWELFRHMRMPQS